MIKELWKKEFETYKEYVEEIKDFIEDEEEIDEKKQRMYGFEWNPEHTSGYYTYTLSNTEIKEWLAKNKWYYVKTI